MATQPPGGPGVTRFAARGDHRLSYESRGGSAGAPVLALHDLLADRGQLRPLADPPRDALFRLTLPEARGHGASPMLSGPAYPASALAADVLAVLDAEGLQSVHVVAIGWAVETALALAVSAPQRVNSLALAAPYLPALVAARARGEARQIGSAHLEMMQEATVMADKGQIDRALDLFLGTRMGADWRTRLSKPRLGAIRRSSGNLAPLLAGSTRAPIDPGALAGLDVPAWLLTKDDADILERATVEILASLLPRARTGTLPPGPNEHVAISLEWTGAIAGVLTSAPAPFPARMPLPHTRTSIVSGDDPERSNP